jgi:hypothetical protein
MQDRDVYFIDGKGLELAEPAPASAKKKRRRSRPATEHPAHSTGWPRLAASCSMLLSGTGHLLHRRWRVGLLYLFIVVGTLSFHYFLPDLWAGIRSWATRYDLAETDLLVGLLLTDLYLIMILLLGVFHAFRVGIASSTDGLDPSPHPLGPALASMLVPGWGQIVNGQIGKALAFLFVVYALIFAVAAWLILPGPIEQLVRAETHPLQALMVVAALATIGIVVWALSLYDAALVARYRRT